MRDSEKEFLKMVRKEVRPLRDIQTKMGWTYEETMSFAKLLQNNGQIRLDSWVYADGLVIDVVAKPLLEDKFWRNWWSNFISVCLGAAIGIIPWVAGLMMQKEPKLPMQPQTIVLPPIQLVHDTIWIHDTVNVYKKH